MKWFNDVAKGAEMLTMVMPGIIDRHLQNISFYS